MEKTIEEKIVELENIANTIEDSDTSLDDAIKFFEKGVAVAKECLDSLKQTAGKITMLKKEMEELVEVPFDEDK